MMNTTNFETMKVTELKELCRKAGIKGYSRMKKAELVDALNNSKEMKKMVLTEAKTFAKDELGRDFDKAVMFWKKLNDLKFVSADEYYDLVDGWKKLTSLLKLVDEKTHTINATENLIDTANKIASVLCPQDVDFSHYTEQELSTYILDTLNDFSLSVFSKRLVKETSKMTKISMLDLDMADDYIRFNELRLYDPQKDPAPKNGIPYLDSAEDGISRILTDKGVDIISVFMGITASDPTDMVEVARILDMKKRILTEGFYLMSGKHYMPAFQSPSANRRATLTFVSVTGTTIQECREEIQRLWLDVTGLKDWDAFEKAFYDKNGNVVIAKVVARLSTRGSNSFSIAKVAPDIADIIKNLNVRYVEDTETEVFKRYQTVTEAGTLEMVEGESRGITDGDGQGIIDFITSAYIASGLRRISRNELDYFLVEWDKVKHDVHNVRPGSRLDKIIRKIPAVFQIRHGEKKGLLVRWNLEAIDATKDINVIIPDSVRKFIGGEWSEYPLEICNFLKNKSEWAYLNPQFISALAWENPNALIKIAQYWEQYEVESFDNIAKAQQFHGIIKSSDDEDNETTAGNLVCALRTSSDLIDDFQILNWRKDQYNKFNNDMKIGRLMVPGQYTYMIFDPAYLINKWFGLDLPCLASGEFYHNGKTCRAMLARSPLIAPYEAQCVQLVNNEDYRYLADTVVFNGFDGTADDMGGGDHDGDQCEVVCDDTEFGKIIVDGVRECNYIVWEEPKGAQKVPFTWDNLIDYWANDGATIDKTGIITNYASRALDIANHLKSCIYFAKHFGCETVTFVHPKSFGKGLGCNRQPQTEYVDGKLTFSVKALIEAKFTKNAQEKYANKNFDPAEIEPWEVWFPYDFGKETRGFIGTKTFDEIEAEIAYYMDIVHRLRLFQGEEIDGAKTGYHPEIPSFVEIKLTAKHMLTRQEVLSKEQGVSSKLNVYWSLSPLGRLHDYSQKVSDRITDMFGNGSNKLFLLQSLLTDEEAEMLNKKFPMTDGSMMNIKEIIDIRKNGQRDSKKRVVVRGYNQKIFDISNTYTGDDKTNAIRELKDAEVYGTKNQDGSRNKDGLYDLANALGITPQVVAVACYIVAYTKDTKQSEGLTYGWLLFDELISVFSRGNKKYELFRLPASVEKACIVDKVLYVNDNKYIDINAENCDNVVIQVINGRPYGLIHKVSSNAGKQRKSDVVLGAKTYTIGTYGFKHHIVGSADPKQVWKQLVKENGFVFDITMDATNRAVLSINGKSISALMPVGADFDLMNKKVKVVNNPQVSPIKESNASITNLQVVIIGEIQ